MNVLWPFFGSLPAVFLVLAISSTTEGHGNCHFTFSTVAVVASGHTEHPLFDITKPETMHTIGTALRYELVTLGKNPSTENIDALHAQLPQIIAWVKNAPERVTAQAIPKFPPYQKRDIADRAEIFSRILSDLETSYLKRKMTYHRYLRLQYELALLASNLDRSGLTGLERWAYDQAETGLSILEKYEGVMVASFDVDPSHIDFFRALGNFSWAAVKTTFTPDLDMNRDPIEHLAHDVNGHAHYISRTLNKLSFYEKNQLLALRDFYLTRVRPELAEPQRPLSDAIMAHLAHNESIYPSPDKPRSGLKQLFQFAFWGETDPFSLAAKEIIRLRTKYENYREELQGGTVEVNQGLEQMAKYLKQQFLELMEFQPPKKGEL